jgi:hypothetical protein
MIANVSWVNHGKWIMIMKRMIIFDNHDDDGHGDDGDGEVT